jgi:hypothetical protein
MSGINKYAIDGPLPKNFEKQAKKLMDLNNPQTSTATTGQVPFYQTGARAFIKIGGKPLGVCQDFRWSVSYQGTPITTIDSTQPWDIDVGSMSVTASLNQIMDPSKGPEVDNLLPIMSSAIHQPMVELQVLDKLGTSLFFARGMFLSCSGNISKGAVSSISAQFVGVFYQHFVSQSFQPYGSIAGGLSGLANGLKNLASDATGGLL